MIRAIGETELSTAELRELSEGRLPPQALEAERSVLGAILLDREAVGRCLE
ncbi:MAG: hypothetical protein HKN21_01615, partial [Candidatus Eisenbacteria bacterium]|nr:hypothetical protein [Candidatus Eisenbacteria bacterium]